MATWAHVSAPAGAPTTQSTPRGEWHAGAVPYLYQTDGAWADVPYAGETVETSGCGPTCLSMACIALTGRTDRDPGQMAQYSERRGFVEGGLTSWQLFTLGTAELGLACDELPADAVAVEEALAAGSVVVASVGPGDFTTMGHFIVIAGVRDDGLWNVHDPNSAERSAQGWEAQRVLEQCRALWALSA